MNIMKKSLGLTATAALLLTSSSALYAQKSGQSIQIQYGVVVGAVVTQEQSDAGKGALKGGTIGLYSARNNSSSTKAASAAIGAGLGARSAKKSQGSLEAREYHVQTATGMVVIISDQLEIHVDDCVSVENGGSQNANIRRVSNTYCDPASAAAVASVQDEAQEEAAECASAKQELAAASGDEAAFDAAFRKVTMLCDM